MQVIGPNDSVRETIARFPQSAAVFARHGLGGCGGPGGPDERIDFFARMHRVDVLRLLADLNQAAADPAVAPEPAPGPTDLLYRRFVATALIATVTLGASFGAYNLACIQLALGPIPPPHNWAHAAFQILGFVLMFVMGVGYHVVPRFWGKPLAFAWAARASFWLLLGGLLLRTYGQFGAILPMTAAAYRIGATGIFLAVLAFAGVLGATWLAARPARDRFHRFLAAGTAFYLLAAVLAGGPQEWHEAFYRAALFGGTLFWIQGMLLRIGPGFLGLQPQRANWLELAFALGLVGVPLATAGNDLGVLLVAFDVIAFATGARLLERRVHHEDRLLGRTMQFATGATVLFAALAVQYVLSPNPQMLVWDGARHAFALGFVTLTIFAIAGRVLPIFGGTTLAWPRARAFGIVLIAIAIVMREFEVAAALLAIPSLLTVSGLSGVVGATGVALASASILATLRRRGETAPKKITTISADVNVAALIDTYPDALPVLIAAGFAPLANPLARRTLARAVSLRMACQLHHVDVDELVAKLRAACTPPGPLVPTSRLVRHA